MKVVVCDCGEPNKNTDPNILLKEHIQTLQKTIKELKN